MGDEKGQMINLPAHGHDTPGYLVQPEGEGPFPAIAAIQGWWGLVPHMKEVAKRLAKEGCVALLLDLYYGRTVDEHSEARKLATSLDGGIPVSMVQYFEKELEKNRIPHEVHIYDGATGILQRHALAGRSP